MSAWETKKIGQLGRVVTGSTPPTKDAANYGAGYLFVTPSDLNYDSYYVTHTERSVTPMAYDKLKTRFVPKDSVMFTCIASIGKIGLSSGEVLTNQQINSLVTNEENDAKFLYYLLRHNTEYIARHKSGVAVPIINKEAFEQIELSLPPLPIQRRIASILSDYDAAIANCRRQIALLEEAAQRLYREWFAEGKGEKKVIEEICDTIGGGTPSTSHPEYWNGDVPWVVPTDLTKNTYLTLLATEKKITKLGLEKSSAKMLPPKTILMTSRASVGYFGIADFSVCTNQGFISIVPHEEKMRWYLLFNLRARVEEIRAKAKGATFAEISKSSFRAMEVVVPDQIKLSAFDSFISMIMEQENALSRQIRALTEARDRLLPKLMRGEIAV